MYVHMYEYMCVWSYNSPFVCFLSVSHMLISSYIASKECMEVSDTPNMWRMGYHKTDIAGLFVGSSWGTVLEVWDLPRVAFFPFSSQNHILPGISQVRSHTVACWALYEEWAWVHISEKHLPKRSELGPSAKRDGHALVSRMWLPEPTQQSSFLLQ